MFRVIAPREKECSFDRTGSRCTHLIPPLLTVDDCRWAAQNDCRSPHANTTTYESNWARFFGCGVTSSITPSAPANGELFGEEIRTRSPRSNWVLQAIQAIRIKRSIEHRQSGNSLERPETFLRSVVIRRQSLKKYRWQENTNKSDELISKK